MLADSEILHLPKVSLETKELLPEFSGIYYVVDENKIVWYLGKAKNIRKRWQGKAHHRIYQLKQLKYKYFDIYYEGVDVSQLDRKEQQQIAKYNPHLNNSPVKNKKVYPTETLLRETISTISDFAFILGVEPPRREIKDQIRGEWLIQEKILDIPVIHVCFDSVIFKALFNPQLDGEDEAILTRAFNTRKTYTSKWEALPYKKYPLVRRLSVNGYAIEVNYLNFWTNNKNTEISRTYHQTKIAQESIRALTSESLIEIQDYVLAQGIKKNQLERLKPYKSDLIPLFFNETIDTEYAKQKLEKISRDYRLGKRGIGSRSNDIDSSFILDELLITRGINIHKYDKYNVSKSTSVLINEPRSRYKHKGVYLYFQGFNFNTKTVYSFQQTIYNSTFLSRNFIYGMLNDKIIHLSFKEFKIIYLLAEVDKKGWLLVEKYLKEFSQVFIGLNNGESVVEKFYVSPRKFVVPAKVNIKLEDIGYSAWIPFGMNKKYSTFEAAKQEIKTRLYQADLPGLKLTFKKESIAK